MASPEPAPRSRHSHRPISPSLSQSPPARASRRSNHRDRSLSPSSQSHRRSRRHRSLPSSSPSRSRSRSRSPSTKHHRRDRSKSPDSHSRSHHHRRHRRHHHHHHRSRRRSNPRSRSRSPSRSRSRSRSPTRHRRRSLSRSPHRLSSSTATSQPSRNRKPLPSQALSFQHTRGGDVIDPTDPAEAPPAPKERPNFKPTGLLAAETNKIVVPAGPNHDGSRPGGANNSAAKATKTIILKYHEPPEARKPPPAQAWVLYIFKGSAPEPLDTIPLHVRSCWLLGREAAVADVLVEHPSTSKQHAVFQFRYVTKKDEFGDKKSGVKLYVLDLESANGTRLNGERLEAARYVEVKSGDVVRIGESERDYVVLLPPKE